MRESEKLQREKKQTPFITYIEKLYPELQGTEVPASLIGIICGLKPLCQPNPLRRLGIDLIKTKNNFAIIRGSATKRDQHYTPSSYWDVSRVFTMANEQQIGEDSRGITHQVVNHLQEGPRDLDVRYYLNPGNNNEDVEKYLCAKLTQQGYVRQDHYYIKAGYKITIDQYKLESKHGDRIIFNINYFKDGHFIMRLDLGEMPNAAQLADDGRISIFSPAMDIITASNIGIVDDQLVVETPIFSPEDFMRQEAAMCSCIPDGYGDYYANYLMGFISSISNLVLWSSTKVDEPYSYLQLMINANASAAYVYHYLEQRSGLSKQEEIQKLAKREVDIVSRFFLIFTYDLPLALQLFYDSYLHKATIFGGLLSNNIYDAVTGQYLHQKFKAVRTKVAEIIKPGFHFDPDPEKAMAQLPELSQIYKDRLTHATSIEETGLFMLLQAMKECGLLESSTPLSLSTLVVGFSPFSFSLLPRP